MTTFKNIEEVYNYMDFVLWSWKNQLGVDIEKCGPISNTVGFYISLKRSGITNQVFIRTGTINKQGSNKYLSSAWMTIIINDKEHIIDISQWYYYRKNRCVENFIYTVGKNGKRSENGRLVKGFSAKYITEKICDIIRSINEEHKIKA